MLKRLIKQRNHYLSLDRKSFKNQENIKGKQEAGNLCQKRGFPAITGGLESLYYPKIFIFCFNGDSEKYTRANEKKCVQRNISGIPFAF